MSSRRLSPLAALAIGCLAVAGLVVASARADRRGRPAPAPIVYSIADGSPEAGFRETDRQLATWAVQAWARQADPAVTVVEGGEETATIRIHWVRADDGLYGEAQRTVVDGRSVTDVFVRPDLAGLGDDIEEAARRDPLFRDTVVYLTCVHEIGHAFDLPHTASFADIMYSFQYGGDFVAYFRRFRDQLRTRSDIRTASPFSPADQEAFRSALR